MTPLLSRLSHLIVPGLVLCLFAVTSSATADGSDPAASIDAFLSSVADEQPSPRRQTTTFIGGERNLAAQNPLLSITGDFVGSYTRTDDDNRRYDNTYEIRGAELVIESALDPYTYGKAVIHVEGDGDVELEELYVRFDTFARNMRLELGRYKLPLGVLNRWHEHAWPQVDAPLAMTGLGFDGELVGSGASLELTLPRGLSDSTRLTMQGVWTDRDDDDDLFSGSGSGTPLRLLRFANFWEVSEGYVELGLTGAWGETDPDDPREARMSAVDFTYCWDPPQSNLHQGFTFRVEWFRLQEDLETLERTRLSGWYADFENRLSRTLLAGVRYDSTDFRDEDYTANAISPYLTIWQSEFTRHRIQYTRERRSDGVNDSRLLFQTTWSIGPHMHDEY